MKCPHCKNDNESMIEIEGEWNTKRGPVQMMYCKVCSKNWYETLRTNKNVKNVDAPTN